jgi:hypothetical protein
MLCGGTREREDREYSETILLVFARARGLLNNLSFFLLIIGFKEIK